ncbi:MAG: hypothetical protein SGI74_01805 [Oligoflexia bacterium]|nr:hypothetical protein [Oligoflexia bacterium]
MSDKVSYVAKWILLGLVTSLGITCAHKPLPKNGPIPTTLVLGVDGISYLTFKKLQDGGHFRNFMPVAPMYASFPSISDPNWTKLYNLPIERGFTKAFFDPTIKTPTGMGKENGGITSHFTRHPLYEDVSDFRLEGAWEHLSMLIWTETTALYWLESLEKQFFEFRGRKNYFGLIINSDILSHTEGEKNVMKYLVKIEERIEKIQKRYKELYHQDLEVIFVSDHGNTFLKPKDVLFQPALEKAGWKFAPTIAHPKDIGFYVPEMLSFAAFYCQPKSARELALNLAKINHIQTTFYAESPTDIRAIGLHGLGEAQLIVDEKNEMVDYKVLRGPDPLKQTKYFKKGPLSFDAYFLASQNDIYPNVVTRVWEGFTNNSITKPQVLVDPELGYVFGNKALRLVTEVRGFSSTHGGLHREQTMGIFVSTKRQFPAIRPQDFRKFVRVDNIGK